uniref:Carbohydrate-binding family 9-like protein n=1 Tax=Roseihalotalea indica TaxID=2867963 RepID=A0AA49GSX7_9BACT|nr:carbohydrate-binding family 9-like protein [Tunicatimonas sp. TK19036]
MKFTLPLFLLISLFSSRLVQAQTNKPKQYVAYQARAPIVIDGKADAAWDAAPWSDEFIDIEGDKIPTYQTRMKMLWDSAYLYFYAELEEPHIWGDIKERDAVIFYNNDFEIFIDPDGDTHNYLEFEMNALNTVWDLWLTKPYRNGPKVIDAWDIQGLKTAVQINGTLNQPNDTDQGWSVEIAMPWATLAEAGSSPRAPKNAFWRINFSRVNWNFELEDGKYSRKKDDKGKYLPEYNWVWSPQEVINMHEPERWGYVYFSEKTSGPDEAFQLPTDESLKWQLYEVYRKVRGQATQPDFITPDPLQIDGQTIPVRFEKHLSGWNLWVISPETGHRLLLKEDGEFVTQSINNGQ